MQRKILFFFALTISLPAHAIAQSYYGANVSYAAIAKEPPTLHGYQVMLAYYPACLSLDRYTIYFDGGFSHFWVTNTPYYTVANVYSIAPVLRFLFQKRGFFHPFVEISVGLSYLNHTRLDSRNLGIHFAFQDRIGVGVLLGAAEQFSIGMHAMHYSNARLSEHNSGITAPLMLDFGFRF